MVIGIAIPAFFIVSVTGVLIWAELNPDEYKKMKNTMTIAKIEPQQLPESCNGVNSTDIASHPNSKECVKTLTTGIRNWCLHELKQISEEGDVEKLADICLIMAVSEIARPCEETDIGTPEECLMTGLKKIYQYLIPGGDLDWREFLDEEKLKQFEGSDGNWTIKVIIPNQTLHEALEP